MHSHPFILITGILITIHIAAGCGMRGEIEKQPEAGLNGGFEIVQNGLPVNWLIYTPAKVPKAEFDIYLDKEVFKEGSQSLCFDVKEGTQKKGWRSPGLNNEFYEIGKFEGPADYRLSFWLLNKGSTFTVDAGPVSSKKGNVTQLLSYEKNIDSWDFYSYDIHVPEGQWLRFQLNVLSEGRLWIDGFLVEKL